MSSYPNVFGKTPLASFVLSLNGGITTVNLKLLSTKYLLYRTSLELTQLTKPPISAGVVLSGCPSIFDAMLCCDVNINSIAQIEIVFSLYFC